jgi:hypothetical protein
MWMVVLALVAALIPTCAQAQARPSTVTMTCAQAARLVTSQGAIVLGTGGSTFDRFVTDRRFCAINQTTEPAWVPAADNLQCFVGYRCKEPTSEHEGDSRD